jgi:hypothetical protein
VNSFSKAMQEFKNMLEEGIIQDAYQGLMDYFRRLKAQFAKTYPVSGSIYYGYMDMTYFSLFPELLKSRKLKIAVVFVYETFQFEVWLSGANRDVQVEYWNHIKAADWDRYPLSPDPRREDYVIGQVLIADPDFGDLTELTSRIEDGTSSFINNVEEFIATVETP